MRSNFIWNKSDKLTYFCGKCKLHGWICHQTDCKMHEFFPIFPPKTQNHPLNCRGRRPRRPAGDMTHAIVVRATGDGRPYGSDAPCPCRGRCPHRPAKRIATWDAKNHGTHGGVAPAGRRVFAFCHTGHAMRTPTTISVSPYNTHPKHKKIPTTK